MENQAIQNPTPEPTLTPVQVSEPKAKFPVMYLVLSLFILVLLTSTVFLYYQNTQLKNMLASYQTQPAISPTPTTYQSPPPSTTTNPTANWKTYTGKVYSFKYPGDYLLNEGGDGTNVNLASGSGVFLYIYPLETLTYENFLDCTNSIIKGCLVKFNSQANLTQDVLIDGKNAKSFYFTVNGLNDVYHTVEIIDAPKTGLKAFIESSTQDKPGALVKDDVFNQILSTFKFTN